MKNINWNFPERKNMNAKTGIYNAIKFIYKMFIGLAVTGFLTLILAIPALILTGAYFYAGNRRTS
jgi:tetrahydromethanopterin S-methyltransferase subunit B